jgi:hypothetical protein
LKPAAARKISEFESAMKAEGFCLLPTGDKKLRG